tara:strand:- start:2445 stop:4031 length:1587 start_codon:yes stop_codon:yes gene_type:complete
MSDKKHIDRLFQESFKDFEATPSDAVWENIEAQLNQKKKKRRVIPIWWRYAGVAALLLLLLTVGINYFNTDDNTQTNQIVDTENNTSTEQNDESNGFDTLKKADGVITHDNTLNDNSNEVNEAVANTNSEKDDLQKSSQDQNILSDKINASKESAVAETSASQSENERRGHTNLSSKEKSNIKNSALKTENKTVIASNTEKEKSADKSIQNKEDESLIDKNEASRILNAASKNNTGIAQKNSSKEEEKSESVVEEKAKDNSLTIEEAINKTEDIIEEEKLNRWSIAPNAAPVYFNTLGEGSSIDPQFNGNSKTGELNMSYGISASYAVNKKLSIRSGVNRVNLGYNTNNVVIFQSLGVSSSSKALRNVDIASGSNNVSDAFSNGSNENLSIISGEGLSTKVSPGSFSTNTSINQALAYVEVPIEIQYNLSNKKFGVNVIGGFSSFFLSDNKIYSEAESGSRTFLGEATNINKVSYSANFGLGLNYPVSKKIDLNLEPMFKYQINTFNNTSGDFQPFFIGVYTGFAIKF